MGNNIIIMLGLGQDNIPCALALKFIIKTGEKIMGTNLWILVVFAGLAAVLHILFFLMESVYWKKPAVMKIFLMEESSVETTKLLAFNQGFYNLFLAIGNLAGILIVLIDSHTLGTVIMASNCAIMFGASIVLIVSSPKMIRGALLQGIFPLLFLLVLIVKL
jgi:putative membrane protein